MRNPLIHLVRHGPGPVEPAHPPPLAPVEGALLGRGPGQDRGAGVGLEPVAVAHQLRPGERCPAGELDAVGPELPREPDGGADGVLRFPGKPDDEPAGERDARLPDRLRPPQHLRRGLPLAHVLEELRRAALRAHEELVAAGRPHQRRRPAGDRVGAGVGEPREVHLLAVGRSARGRGPARAGGRL